MNSAQSFRRTLSRASDVGYKRPPTETQFKKGSSGNPKGRPKGSKNLASLLEKDGRQLVTVKGPTGTRSVPKKHALLLQLANLALQANLPALRLYLSLSQAAEATGQAENPVSLFQEVDAVMLESIKKRKRSMEQVINLTNAVHPKGEQ